MTKKDNIDQADEVAARLQQEKDVAAFLDKTTKRLYELRCFETMTHPNGMPIAMRVPGGWIFFTGSGGGSIRLTIDDGDDEQNIIGDVNRSLIPVFVPFSAEFIRGPQTAPGVAS